MSHKNWVVSDTHFGHRNIIVFTDDAGNRIRPFDSVEHHDEMIIKHWNDAIGPYDRVYHLGDVVINRRFLDTVKRLNGKKRLIRGNHDLFKTKDYMDVGFEEIYGVKVFEKHGIILSHVPIHPDSFNGRSWVTNWHGHTHANIVKLPNGHPDPRYVPCSLEHTDFKPKFLF